MPASINSELICCQPRDDQLLVARLYKGTMQATRMADRIKELAGTNGAEIARRVTLAGYSVTTQAVHKWLNDGDMSEDALAAFCRAYPAATPAYIRYGVKTCEPLNEKQAAAAELVQQAPDDIVQLTFDFMEYQIQRAETMITGEKAAHYLALIDKITHDMKRLRGKK